VRAPSEGDAPFCSSFRVVRRARLRPLADVRTEEREIGGSQTVGGGLGLVPAGVDQRRRAHLVEASALLLTVDARSVLTVAVDNLPSAVDSRIAGRRQENPANRYIHGGAGDAVGTLQRLSSTFSALSRPPYQPGPFKDASNVVVSEELALGDWGLPRWHRPSQRLLRASSPGDRVSGGRSRGANSCYSLPHSGSTSMTPMTRLTPGPEPSVW
jgi:hypothetical protein